MAGNNSAWKSWSRVAAPSANGLTLRGASNTYYDMNKKPAGNTIQPGVYCGGLSVGNTGGATYTMALGVYVMAGGASPSTARPRSPAPATIYNTSGANSGVSGCNSGFQ